MEVPYKAYVKFSDETYNMVKREYEENGVNFRTQMYALVLDESWESDNVVSGLKDYSGRVIDTKLLKNELGETTGTTNAVNSETFRLTSTIIYQSGNTKVYALSTGSYIPVSEVIKLESPKIKLLTGADYGRIRNNKPYYKIYDYYDGPIESLTKFPKDIIFDRQLRIKPISKKTFDRGSLVLEEHYASITQTGSTIEYHDILVKEENNYVYDETTGNPVRRETNIYYAMSDDSWSTPLSWPKYYTNGTEAESAGIRKRSTIITELQEFVKLLEIMNPALSGHTAYFLSFFDAHFEDAQKFIQKNTPSLYNAIATDKDDVTNGVLWGLEVTTPINPTPTPIWQLALYYLS